MERSSTQVVVKLFSISSNHLLLTLLRLVSQRRLGIDPGLLGADPLVDDHCRPNRGISRRCHEGVQTLAGLLWSHRWH